MIAAMLVPGSIIVLAGDLREKPARPAARLSDLDARGATDCRAGLKPFQSSGSRVANEAERVHQSRMCSRPLRQVSRP